MTAANEALSTDTPATVTFDTLKATQELRKTGFEDRQAEAVVTTINKAMSETVATKADLQLVRSDFDLLRSEFEILRSEFESLRQHVDSRLDALENRIILKLGGLMVTMAFLLLAIGPFYIRWVMSLMGTS